MDGFINLLKPAGMTSHDAVGALRRILRTKKTGHTGTLDPMACGVLCICIGRGTRAAEYLEQDRKSYRCELTLGQISDTGDCWGTVSEGNAEAADAVTADQVLAVLESFKGEQLQYPPMYSAVKVNGRRLYEYARNGESVEVKPRKITVHRLSPVRILEEPRKVMFDIECSKGTYLRTICMEIGERLGCGGLMSMLIRTASGRMKLEDSVTFESILEAVSESEGLTAEQIMSERRNGSFKKDLSSLMTPIDTMLSSFGKVTLAEEDRVRFVNGGKISGSAAEVEISNTEPEHSRFRDLYRIYGPDQKFIGTAARNPMNGVLTADKVFFR